MSGKVNWVAEASAATLSSKSGAAAVGGGLSGFFAFVAGINWFAWVSLSATLLALLINFYFSYQRDRREKAKHQLEMKKLEGDCDVKK